MSMRSLAPRTSVASWLQSNSRPCSRSELATISGNGTLQVVIMIPMYDVYNWGHHNEDCVVAVAVWMNFEWPKSKCTHLKNDYLDLLHIPFPGQFYSFTVYMVCANSIVNPFVYAIQYHEFQQRIKEVFFCKPDQLDITTSKNTVSTSVDQDCKPNWMEVHYFFFSSKLFLIDGMLYFQ